MKKRSSLLSIPFRRLIAGSILCSVAFFFVMAKVEAETPSASEPTTLEGAIQVTSANPMFGDRLYPGQDVVIRTTVKNHGKTPTSEGELFVRFAFNEPLHGHPQSVSFQTEKVSLPPLIPGEERDLQFATLHRWPSLLDYVQDDWAMRQYQAVFVQDEEEYLIGNLNLSVSAHYYTLPNDKMMAAVPGAK